MINLFQYFWAGCVIPAFTELRRFKKDFDWGFLETEPDELLEIVAVSSIGG